MKLEQKALLTGNEAIARGAWEGGCQVATAYPGTPSTEILENVNKYKEIHSQWCVNEKVALEVGAGAAYSGARTLVTMKHVGVNVAADPLFTMAYTGVKGGLVLVSADDPGMHSSQNEQDNRHYARSAKIAMLEPSDSNEALLLVKKGFEISEKFDIPVMLRTTTRINHTQTIVSLSKREENPIELKFEKNDPKLVMLPAYAVARRTSLEERIERLRQYSEEFELNEEEILDTDIGIVTSGISYQYVKEVFPNKSIFKITMSWPLPIKKIQIFSKKVKRLLVIEELDPFIENELKTAGIWVEGKSIFPSQGELSSEIIRNSFHGIKEEQTKDKIPSRPPAFCPGCPHEPVFSILSELNVPVMGDIGCYTLGALSPYKSLNACLDMGASIGMAQGVSIVNSINNGKDSVIAVIGDSTFIHSGITNLIDMVYNKQKALVIILDNRTTAMTGAQENPGTGVQLNGEKTFQLNFENIVKSCGVERIHTINPYKKAPLKELIQKELEYNGVSVIITDKKCVLIK